MIGSLKQRLANSEVVIIDGGMGPELARRGVPMHPVAWAGPAVLDHQDIVRAAHEDYIKAGADVIITNTFMTNLPGLTAAGFGDQAREINARSVAVAREARDNVADRPVVIAAALFPGYFGAENNDIFPLGTDDPDEQRVALHDHATMLAEAGADLFALEMIPTGVWGHMAVKVLAEFGLPIWVGVSYGALEGSPITLPFDPPGQVGKQVEQIVADTRADVMAVTVMHTEMKDLDHALDDIERYWDGPLGAYPHHGTHDTEGTEQYVSLPIEPTEYAAAARQWVDRGVQIIGGCCGIGPEHVRALKDELPARIPESTRQPATRERA